MNKRACRDPGQEPHDGRRFHKAEIAAGARDNGPGPASHAFHPSYSARSCSITTGTMLKRFAMIRLSVLTSRLNKETSQP